MRQAFEQAILENPDEVAGYAVYSDWLQEQGDPHGEFIRVQLALEDANLAPTERDQLRQREQELQQAHQAEWLGPLAPFLLNNPTVRHVETREEQPNYDFRFARGFLDTLRICRLFVPMARVLRDAPQTPFLRELVVEYIADDDEHLDQDEPMEYPPGDDVPTWDRDHIQFVSIYPLLGTPTFANLRRLRIGAEVYDDHFFLHTHAADCHTYCSPAADLVEKMPRLEELHLLCKDYDIARLFASRALTNLKVLRMYHLGVQGVDGRDRDRYEYPLDILAANPTFRNLIQLLFHPHHEQWTGHSFLPQEQVQALVNSPHLANLTHLQLRLSNMGDEGCRVIVDSGILRRLKWLDLRHGGITDDGAHILAACPDLKGLEHLDLCRNALTASGAAALQATGINVRAEAQQTPRELAEEAYLSEGDFE